MSSKTKGRARRSSNVRIRQPEGHMLLALANVPRAFPRQPVCELWVPGGPVPIPRTSGILAYVSRCDPENVVVDWSTRFQVVFKEYRVVRWEIKVRASQASTDANGEHVAWFDEKNGIAPTLAGAYEQTTRCRPNNSDNPKSSYVMSWTPQDVFDYEFKATNSGASPVCYAKFYSDIVGFANVNDTANNQLVIQPWFLIQFRGFETN